MQTRRTRLNGANKPVIYYGLNSGGSHSTPQLALCERRSFQWCDYKDTLVGVTCNGNVAQTNSYDGDGNRVEQVAGGSTLVYSYQGVNILYQRNLTSGVVTKSFYAGGIQVAQMVDSGVYYLHQDALGSTVLVMTATVTPSFTAKYIPYGPSLGVTGSEAFQYTGKLLDEATGLYYEGPGTTTLQLGGSSQRTRRSVRLQTPRA